MDGGYSRSIVKDHQSHKIHPDGRTKSEIYIIIIISEDVMYKWLLLAIDI